MAIGHELRQSIVQAVQTQAVSQERLAQMLGVSVSSIKRVWQRWRQTGSSQALPPAGGKKPKLSPAQCEQISQHVQADTDVTLQELQRWLAAKQTVRLSLSTLSRLLTKLNLPRKKDPPRHRTRHPCQPAKARRLAHTGSSARSGAPGVYR